MYDHPVGSGHCWQCKPAGTAVTLQSQQWDFGDPPKTLSAPSPSCTGTLSPLATSKGSHFAVVAMAPAVDLSHSHMPPLTPAELLI